jgi:hypothetical protein
VVLPEGNYQLVIGTAIGVEDCGRVIQCIVSITCLSLMAEDVAATLVYMSVSICCNAPLIC